MEDIKYFKTIDEYNKMLGVETLHPLVSVIDMSKTNYTGELPSAYRYGFYTVFLKDVKCGNMKYGRNYYDYQEGTLVFMTPEQLISIENRVPHQLKGWALVFHPDLLNGTSLGHSIHHYTFFSYEVSEALHLSLDERKIVLECFINILSELNHSIDNHTQRLIVSNIELFLNYSTRFYERQFMTREKANSTLLKRFETLLNSYFNSDKPETLGIPSVKYCADKLNLSPNYLGDLIKRETSHSPQEHIQHYLIEIAKEKMCEKEKTVSQVAYELGFEYPQYFSRLFKKCVGMTPNEYRAAL